MKLIKPQERQATVSITILFLLLIAFAGSLYAQNRTHDLGDFKLRIDAFEFLDTNQDPPTGAWPQDVYRYDNIVFHASGFTIGSFIDDLNEVNQKYSRMYVVDYNQTEPYGIREFRRYEPPEVWVFSEGVNQLSSRRFNGTVVPDLVADQVIEKRYKTYPGFDVLKRSFAFSNPNHDDYVIIYCRYLCTFDSDEDPEPDIPTDQTLEDVYFLLGYTFQTAEGTQITYSRWYEEGQDDWATYEAYTPTLVSGGRDLHISYGWDGDHPDLDAFEPGGQEFDDTGDPRFATGEYGSTPMPSGEFVSSAYAGFAALHVDQSTTDHSDDITQPTSVAANLNIYNVWDHDFPGYATPWDWASSGQKQTHEDAPGWPEDPREPFAEFPFQSFGPYDFNLGDSIVFVYAIGANGISHKLAIEKGLEWRSWYRGEAGADFDNDAKNALLATGRDSLFQTMDRALWAWNRNLNIPAPLPAPDLTVTSGPNVVYLEWEDLSQVGDANTGTPDLDHYRIYRKRGDFLVDTYDEINEEGTHQLWEFLTTVPANQTTYTDDEVIRGEAYHYAVTAVDDGSQNADGLVPGQKLESSKYANRSEIDAYPFAPGENTTDKVRVVPNPYITQAKEFNFTGDDNRLLFVNLPPYCTLRIFTITGDLIKTIDHQTGSADENWDQVTESNQFIASGVYILQISDARDLNNNKLPDANEKFVIVR